LCSTTDLRRGGRAWLIGCGFLLLVGCVNALRDPADLPPLADPAADAGRVDVLLEQAAALYAARDIDSVELAATKWIEAAAHDETRVEGLLGATRARIWLAGERAEEEQRRREAGAAVEAAQRCRLRMPGDPRCTYWLAVAVGVQARERRTTALNALPLMVDLLRQAIAEDPQIDHAGPHRALALVYVRAPGWPRGPGDPDLGLVEARHAVEMEPEYPPNQLCLGESLEAVEEPAESRTAYRRAAELARDSLAAGEQDAAGWIREAEAALAR